MKIPFVKEGIKATRTKTMERTKPNLKEGKQDNLTLCVVACNYDEHCLNRNTSEKDIRSVMYAYIKETGEDWTIELYPGELSEKQLEDGMIAILSNPHQFHNQKFELKK